MESSIQASGDLLFWNRKAIKQQLPQKDCIGKMFVLMMIVTNILRQSCLIFLKKKFFLNLKRNSVQIIYVADR